MGGHAHRRHRRGVPPRRMRYGSLAGELTDADDQIHGDLAGGYQETMQVLFIDGLEAMRAGTGELVCAASPPHLAALVIAHQGGAMLPPRHR